MNHGIEKSGENISLESLHHDFFVNVGGDWLWNKNPALYMGEVDRKVLFLFNEYDSEHLNECPFVAKIGKNVDVDTNSKYNFIGFAYGDKSASEDLKVFARRFEKSQMIEGLTDTWVSKQNAKITDL